MFQERESSEEVTVAAWKKFCAVIVVAVFAVGLFGSLGARGSTGKTHWTPGFVNVAGGEAIHVHVYNPSDSVKEAEMKIADPSGTWAIVDVLVDVAPGDTQTLTTGCTGGNPCTGVPVLTGGGMTFAGTYGSESTGGIVVLDAGSFTKL